MMVALVYQKRKKMEDTMSDEMYGMIQIVSTWIEDNRRDYRDLVSGLDELTSEYIKETPEGDFEFVGRVVNTK